MLSWDVQTQTSWATLADAWESTPIIKLYDDVANAVSVGIAEATISEAGVVKKPLFISGYLSTDRYWIYFTKHTIRLCLTQLLMM